MEYVVLLGTAIAAHLLAVMSPGPDFVMAVKNTLQYSRVTGIWTAVGFGLGIAVHITYSIFGLAFVISQSTVLFTAIKLLGAGYLIYIGYKSLRSKNVAVTYENEAGKNTVISNLAALKMGFLTNVLNPKATLFFLSLFTLILTPETPIFITLTASGVMVLNTIIWFSIVAIFLSQPRVRGLFEKSGAFINRFFGTVLIALGIKIALSK